MHWVTAISRIAGVSVFHARHEHCACVMAIGHYSATGKPSVASVTCGPGFTQITTALASAAHARVPLIVFAGESPLHAAWHNQAIDQGPIAAAAGAHYIRAHSLKRMPDVVREAFYVARHERRPVVIGIPYDLQQQPCPPGTYVPSDTVVPPSRPTIPHKRDLEEVASHLARAERPVILGGRGVLFSSSENLVRELAGKAGALLTTTLPCRGMFDDDEYAVGVSGGFASPVATELLRDADLVLAIGSSLSQHTADSGHLFPKAFVIQIDERPVGLRQGRKAADLFVRADAALAAAGLCALLDARPRTGPGYRTAAVRERIADLFADPTEFPLEPATLDPRMVIEALDRAIPKDWDIVSGSGHSSYFYTHMRNRRPENFHVIREFGAIGNGISIAIGVAATKRTGKVVLLEGDGGLMMHLQELETIRRHRLRLLVCALNDGGFGAEFHKLASEGLDDSAAHFGRPDFAAIARGFGLRGATLADPNQLRELPALFLEHDSREEASVWDFHISDRVLSPRMRTFNARRH
jgi:thiamine pyrophosphate-dependent acetolactate synthase large subunit-like protein